MNASQRERKFSRAQAEKRALSPQHKKLGENLYFHRSMGLRQERVEAAGKLGWTLQKLASVEKGIIDPTLTDLMDLATYMKKGLAEVMNGQRQQ